MATQNPQIVPIAFQSQIPFFFGGSQVPETLLQSGLGPMKKKQKMTHYYKKKPIVIDLVSDSDSGSSSDSDNEPIIFKKPKEKWIIPALTEKELRRMEQAIKEAEEAEYKEIHRKNQELKRKLGFYQY